jgi:ATP-dependent RNA helicase DeaD
MYDGVIDLSHVKCAILDEADELLKAGFFEDIEFIMSCILHEHQTLLFAATMDDDIKKLANDCLRNPK